MVTNESLSSAECTLRYTIVNSLNNERRTSENSDDGMATLSERLFGIENSDSHWYYRDSNIVVVSCACDIVV